MARLKLSIFVLALSFIGVLGAFPGEYDLVTSMPGVTFTLNYRHYSGYLEADHGNMLHYWFFESQSGHHEKDPVVLWLNGGPGCSSMLGALTELGPLFLDKNATLRPNPNAWTGKANVLFLETPSGVGFSYKRGATGDDFTSRSYATSDHATAQMNIAALRSFYKVSLYM